MTWDEQLALDQKHLANPKLGDFWHEMFCPVCVVVGRQKNVVTICKTVKSVGKDHWTWNLDRLEKIELSKFAKWLRYSTDQGGKTWCQVAPKVHKWAAQRRLGVGR